VNPFFYPAVIVCVSPLVGYALVKAFRTSILKVSGISVVGCAILYLIFLLSGTTFLGEEGDYTLFAVLFLLFNILIFQLLRFEKNKFAYAIFVTFFSISSMVVGLQAIITTSYFLTELSKHS
jgi:hypothetical protein